MARKKLTLQQVFDVVETEGLGYAVQYHTGYESIADKDLAKYWKQAKEALDNIQSMLDEYGISYPRPESDLEDEME